ncbi:MAG: hypothetical protein JXX14_07585 [Deltaproteobacteria bacterium]|nr:hypothetical protein [Deltaproteobacteria bacterium]
MMRAESLALARRMVEREMAAVNGVGMSARLFVPAQHYSEHRLLPLVVILHSAGGNGTDNQGQLDEIVQKYMSPSIQNTYPSFVLAPQCPHGMQWTDLKYSMTPYRNYSIDDAPESNRMSAIVQSIHDLCEEFPIDPNRVYITGFSMGSSGTWDLLVRHPDLFAAGITMSGICAPNSAMKLTKIPIWAFHGLFDAISPVANTMQMVDTVRRCGGRIRFTPLPMGHSVAGFVVRFDTVFKWLFQQVRVP